MKFMKDLIEKVGEFNDKFGIKSYFSGRNKDREWPITR